MIYGYEVTCVRPARHHHAEEFICVLWPCELACTKVIFVYLNIHRAHSESKGHL